MATFEIMVCDATMNLMEEFRKTVSEKKATEKTITSLSRFQNDVAVAAVREYEMKELYTQGYALGMLLSYAQLAPEEIKVEEISASIWVKMQMDQLVLEKLKNSNNVTWKNRLQDSYEYTYRRLSELICGYGYNLYFIEERFQRFFAEGTHNVVQGFAEGYSHVFHSMAVYGGIKADVTNPKEQDIWKNYLYFISPTCLEYRIDGMYHFAYNLHGSEHLFGGELPYYSNQKEVNVGVYEQIKAVQKGQQFQMVNIEF